MMARPALRDTDESVFDSASVVSAVVQRLAARYRPAPPVRRLPERVDLTSVRSLAAERARTGIVWALDEFADPVSLDGRESPFLVITGRARCGRTTAARGDHVRDRPGVRAGLVAGHRRVGGRRSGPRAQVWLVTPDRQLLKVLAESYVERFAYRADDVTALAAELWRRCWPNGFRRRACR